MKYTHTYSVHRVHSEKEREKNCSKEKKNKFEEKQSASGEFCYVTSGADKTLRVGVCLLAKYKICLT